MSLTNVDRAWSRMLGDAPVTTQAAIDRAFHAMARELVAAGLVCGMTDAAESLVAAIYRYTVESHDNALRENRKRDAADLAEILS